MVAWQGLWTDVGGTNHALLVDKTQVRKKLGKLFRRRAGRIISEKLKTLLDDSTPASNALVQTVRVIHTPNPPDTELGGVATTETRDILASVAVAAADVTDLQLILEGGAEQDSHANAHPADASGNGGGGKLPN